MKIIRSLLFTCLSLLALNSSAQIITPTDTALTRDLKYTITPFSIKADTADAADSKTLQLTGGGAASSTRGSYIGLYGNEHASNGKLLLEAGDDASDGSIYFNTGGTQHLNIPRSTTPTAELAFGTVSDVNPMLTVRSNKIDGADDAALVLTAGGAFSNTRGAYISMSGNEFITPGVLNLGAGSGGVFIYTGGLQHLNVPYSATQAVDLAYGTMFDASPVFTIRSSRSDGADDGILQLTGGGALGTTRGAGITLQGDDVGGAGAGGGITFEAGTGTAATLKFNAAGSNAWTINADGTLDAAISDAGFRAAAAGDQACTTTCGANKGCLFGYDITTTALVDCTNAAADSCVCTTT